MNERDLDIMLLEAEDWVNQLFEEFNASWIGLRAEEEELEEEVDYGDEYLPGAAQG